MGVSFQDTNILLLDKLLDRTQKTSSNLNIPGIDMINAKSIESGLLPKSQIEENESRLELFLFHQFLLKIKAQKLTALERLNQDIALLSIDLDLTTSLIFSARQSTPLLPSSALNKPRTFTTTANFPSSANGQVHQLNQKINSSGTPEIPTAPPEFASRKRFHGDISENDSNLSVLDLVKPACRSIHDKHQNRLSAHMDDLQMPMPYAEEKLMTEEQKSFSNTLVRCSTYSKFHTVASLHYADNFFNFSSSIVSSIEFDKDDEYYMTIHDRYFATAGVTKKIKLFDFEAVVTDFKRSSSSFITKSSRDVGSINSVSEGYNTDEEEQDRRSMEAVPKYPVKEMSCNSKISCLSWNLYMKSYLLSSDYEGIVGLWDTSVGACVLQLDEHEKRAWSVDFSDLNPTQMASGGDDSKVKLWSTNMQYSTATIETKANVCSVKFNPVHSHHIAFGSADHHIHYYDLRKTSEPLFVFKGHRKAVSYVKFLNSEQLVTASTDCSLRLWSLKDAMHNQTSDHCIRSFEGHVNEKNFVGLSVNSDGDFISCGSETNQVFAYHAKLSKPIASHRFGNSVDAITVIQNIDAKGLEAAEEDPSLFVSSVCWKRKTPNVLVSANSQGRVKVLGPFRT